MNQNDNHNKIEIKIITLGDSKVGKSSLIVQYLENKFSINYLSTIGFDFKRKQLTLKDGTDVKLKIFDTAGQERYRSVADSYIKKANGILLVYDITEKQSFKNIENWLESIREEMGDKLLPIILVGNKSDLKDERKIPTEEGKKKAEEYGFHFYETSCKTGENVNKCFTELAELIYEKTGKKPLQNVNQKLKNDSHKEKKKKRCC